MAERRFRTTVWVTTDDEEGLDPETGEPCQVGPFKVDELRGELASLTVLYLDTEGQGSRLGVLGVEIDWEGLVEV